MDVNEQCLQWQYYDTIRIRIASFVKKIKLIWSLKSFSTLGYRKACICFLSEFVRTCQNSFSYEFASIITVALYTDAIDPAHLTNQRTGSCVGGNDNKLQGSKEPDIEVIS